MQRTIEQYTTILRTARPRNSRWLLYYGCLITLIAIAHQMWNVDFQQPVTEWPSSFFITVLTSPILFICIPFVIFYKNTHMMYFTDEYIQVNQKKYVWSDVKYIVISSNRLKKYMCIAGVAYVQFFFTKTRALYIGNSTESIHEKSTQIKNLFQQIQKQNIDIYSEIRFKPLKEEQRETLFQNIEVYTPQLNSFDMWVFFLYELAFVFFFIFYIQFGIQILWNNIQTSL